MLSLSACCFSRAAMVSSVFTKYRSVTGSRSRIVGTIWFSVTTNNSPADDASGSVGLGRCYRPFTLPGHIDVPCTGLRTELHRASLAFQQDDRGMRHSHAPESRSIQSGHQFHPAPDPAEPPPSVLRRCGHTLHPLLPPFPACCARCRRISIGGFPLRCFRIKEDQTAIRHVREELPLKPAQARTPST
jgi:hypothetical protein